VEYLIPPERLDLPDFTIRAYQPGDGALINAAVNRSYEHLRTFMDWAQPDTPLEESERLVRSWRAQWLQASEFMLGIFSADGSHQLGSTGYMLRGGALRSLAAEIGMWISVDAAGRGLGTRALEALLGWGFTAWPWVRLEWRCDTRNTASRRVAEKAGMQMEGCLRGESVDRHGYRRDMFIFGALRDEWLSAHAAPGR
jgi:ribosomal-protein-serine acetyltransferase